MKAKHLYYVLIGSAAIALLCLVIVGYGANALLGRQAQKLSDLRALSNAGTQQQTAIVKDKQDVTQYSELNTIAKSIVPQDKDQAQTVQQINKIAQDSGITKITSITFPASALGVTNAGAAAKVGLTQLTPVAGITGVYNLQITISVAANDSVPYGNFISFLAGLENNRRTAEVSSVSVTPDPTHAGRVAFTLIVNEFIKP
jgi:hypothetical protein